MKWAVYNFSGLHSWNDPKVYQYPNTLSHHVHTSIIFNKEAFFELILNGTAMCVISWGIQIFHRKTVLIQAHWYVCCILKRTSVCVNQSSIVQRRTDSYQRTQMYVASSNELQCALIKVQSCRGELILTRQLICMLHPQTNVSVFYKLVKPCRSNILNRQQGSNQNRANLSLLV